MARLGAGSPSEQAARLADKAMRRAQDLRLLPRTWSAGALGVDNCTCDQTQSHAHAPRSSNYLGWLPGRMLSATVYRLPHRFDPHRSAPQRSL